MHEQRPDHCTYEESEDHGHGKPALDHATAKATAAATKTGTIGSIGSVTAVVSTFAVAGPVAIVMEAHAARA
jgi:hypothetical protein